HFNALFERILRVDDDAHPAHAYQVSLGEPMDAARQPPPSDAPGIELLLLDAPDTKLNADALHTWDAQVVAARLRALVDGERLIYDKDHGITRPAQVGDCALLFQAMTHVTHYEDALAAAGIPYLTVAGKGYYNRQEVQDLLNLLRALVNPADDLALAAALRSPLFMLSDDALYALRLADATLGGLWTALGSAADNPYLPADQRPKVQFAHACLARLHPLAGRVTISELLRQALAETGFLATLTGLPHGAQRRGNVEKLLTKAHVSGKVTLSDFTAYLEDLSASEVREGGAPLAVEQVVRLMTVHASKGLEFPIVLLPDAAYAPRARTSDVLTVGNGMGCKIMDSTGAWVQPFAYRQAQHIAAQREDAERRRLLYVAATRAQDLLIISGAADTEKGTATGWLGWVLNALADDDLGIPISAPAYEPDAVRRPAVRPAAPAWESAAVRTGQPFQAEVRPAPPLLAAVAPRRLAQARHLAATVLADLGGAASPDADEADAARDRFRRRVLHDAPAVIHRAYYPPPVKGQQPVYRARQLGDLVHAALRWWSLPYEETMSAELRRDLLASYAWENGITSTLAIDHAVDRAMQLLERFTHTPLYASILAAQRAGLPILRELPFIYESDAHIVHGVIDILFQRADTPDERWTLADYKTSRLPRTVNSGGQASVALARHAVQYHVQVGIYAQAAAGYLGGQLPDVLIHYITYGQSVAVAPQAWQAALAHGIRPQIARLVK
ncbi:MAG: PD-(D/E)XK nuclease family protein, partial [Armatimonadetes bacterium]|nr:PD-(D/E)XK nuclease family protein [Anaerolineae bacterium]